VKNPKPTALVRPLLRRLYPYTPGEQPKIKGLIKLNTNENPYPPAPAVLAAIKKSVDGRLRLYPNPTAQPLREKLAKFHGCKAENVFIGNGSDEILALAVRAYVDPVCQGQSSRSTVQYFTPSYSLYPVLAEAHGARANGVQLNEKFESPDTAALRKGKKWDFKAALTLVTTPNAPTGRGFSTGVLDEICRAQKGVVILDEAYADFAKVNAMELAFKHPNVLVARTFSKGYSLCFLRIGYCVGHPELIEALDKIRDSYNVNGLGQVAAAATLDNLPYYQKNFQRVTATRQRVSLELEKIGFKVLPSETNFIFTRPPHFPAEQWLEKLRANKILVRWFKAPEVKEYLRISIGTDREMDLFLKAAKRILA
jgi:histidinol-phosphate aminotransferase